MAYQQTLVILGLMFSSVNTFTDNRRVYVYGDLLLDFARGTEGKHNGAQLKDCSDTTYFCVDGRITNFVVPRTCQVIKVGDSWSLNGIRTTVIADAMAPPSHGSIAYGVSRKAFYLQSDRDVHTLYLYKPDEGIKSIYYDIRGRTDFALLARQGKLNRFDDDHETMEGHVRQHLVKSLVTLDTLAECNKSKSL